MRRKTKTGRNDYEKRVYKQLKRARVKFGYETEKLSYILVCSYLPDFIVDFADGRRLYIETKGYLRQGDKRKLRAVLKTYPGIDLRLLFHEKCKKKDLTWCKKQSIIYAIGLIPKEWLT